jgi:hypothetical protein
MDEFFPQCVTPRLLLFWRCLFCGLLLLTLIVFQNNNSKSRTLPMFDILTLLQSVLAEIKVTTMHAAIELPRHGDVSDEGRVIMLGISRWAGIGGNYWTVMRFFQTVIPWATVFIRPLAKFFLCYDREF